jgi:hypothetical protein
MRFQPGHRLLQFASFVLFPAVLALFAAASDCGAAPQPGYRESFTAVGLSGWQSGLLLSNPGTGGVSGAGDGYLLISQPGLPGNFGAYGATPPYAGDWTAAGITKVTLWLNDVGNSDNMEIHFSIGNGASFPKNFWQYNVGFIPPHGRWASFTVDLAATASFTRIQGSGTFAAALASVDRIHVRHDLAPYVLDLSPDPIAGDVGLDEIFLFASGAADVGPGGRPAVARPLLLAAPAPNPSRGPVTLRMETFDDGPVSVEVVDVTGRAIRRARLPGGVTGARAWTWDGADGAGRSVAAGIYRVRATGSSGGMSQPLIRVQ